MKVYIAKRDYDNAGSVNLGVFTTKAGAANSL